MDVVARYGAPAQIVPLWPGLGTRRTDALAEFLRTHADGRFKDRMGQEERAGIVEGLARALAKAKTPDWRRWTEFYRDLSSFMEGDSDALGGRHILICQDGSLRPARSVAPTDAAGGATPKRRRRRSPSEASVFVPPRRGEAEAEESIGEDFYPPAPLRDFFAFLHDALPWYGELANGRQFLEQKLALPFESEALLNRISQIVDVDTTKKVRSAGLRWAFAIWRRSVAIRRPVALGPNYRLYVPTLEGEFIRASEGIFSASWPESTLGRRLQQFLELAPAGSSDLDQVRMRRIASPSNPVFGTKHLEAWTDFLIGLGVQRGLQPRSVELKHYVEAWRLTNFDFLNDIGLPAAIGALMKEDIQTRGLSLVLLTSTNYEVVQPLWWLPGQSEVGDFSDDALDAYATLVVDWIGQVEHRQLWVEVRHEYNWRSDSRDWPTPLGAFLRSAAWVACEEPRHEGWGRGRQKGADVWLSAGTDRYPPFLRRPSFKLARALDRAPESAIKALRSWAGFKTFNASDTLLAQLEFLAQQFADGSVRRFYERELVNIYNRGWVRLADQHGSVESAAPIGKRPTSLLVRRCGQLGVAQMSGDKAEVVYVRDSADSIAAALVEVIGDPILDARVADPSKLGVLLQRLYGDQIRRTSELAYAILVGGSSLEQLPMGPRLVDQCPWLRLVLAVALEALDGVDLNRLPADRSGIIQSLDRVELQLTKSVSFTLEGSNVTPSTPLPAYAFQRMEGEPLVIIMGENSLSWSQIDGALSAIGDAIQHPAVVPYMRLLVRHLGADGVPIDDRPTGQSDLLWLCRGLGLSEAASEAARDSLGERIDRHLPWLRAVVHLAGGDEAVQRWIQGEAAASEDRTTLVMVLNDCLAASAISAEDLVEAVKVSFSTGELRERLGLDFARFNASLVATGSSANVDPEGQASQVAFFVQDNRIAIDDALRNMAAPTVFGFEPDPRYKAARDALSVLQPDPDWLLRFLRVPDDHLRTHVAKWLEARRAPAMGDNPHGLVDVSVVRGSNSSALRRVGQMAQPLIRAWGVQHATTVHELWRDAGTVDFELRRLLEDAGAFDSRVWTDAELLVWFKRLGVWPVLMDLTLDRNALGVAETEVEAEAQKAREDRETRERESRSVRLNGELRDPDEVDWLKLSEEIAGRLPKSVLNRSIGTFADLRPAGDTRKGLSGSSKGHGGGPYKGIPQSKRDMIGRLGELTVYHWLKARQPGQDIDRCWVSGNGAPFNGRQGEDGLGYDFRISFNKQIWYIEVKASTEDPCQFELGETEVRKARDVARSRAAERYVIAYVANVGQTVATAIEILPNPLGPEADGFLSIAGDSIRYTFSRT